MRPRQSLQTVLFTDIVESTTRAVELGDRHWGKVLAEHHGLVRQELRRFGGREIKTTGDGFLAAFDQPSPAIRCAWSIRACVRRLGLEVRAGIHTGEVEWRGKDLVGVAVHIGARIAGDARPGEILISNAVREMEIGSGFRLADRGKRALKGLPGEWRLFALEDVPPEAQPWIPPWASWVAARRFRIAAVGLVVLVAVGAAFVAFRAFGPSAEALDAPMAGAAPAIAVLPFDVSRPDLGEWREGMVTLLSTGVDGAGELRAIDSRTVLTRWDREVRPGSRGDLATALAVARATGARYAVYGTVVGVGSRLRLSADVYSVTDGSRLGTARAEGAPDSVLSIVDDLARQTLGVLLEEGEGEIPPVDLASVTTGSLPALKALLEGEALYRRGRIDEAIEAYESAVEADSTLALGWMRLDLAYGWRGGGPRELIERAMAHADRLPRRVRVLIEAKGARDPVERIALLRDLIRRHPDEALAWAELGETYFHEPASLGSLDDAEKAFLQAVRLDPLSLPHRFHLTELAFSNPPDSALAARRVQKETAIDPEAWRAMAGRVALDLAFRPARRAVVLDSLARLDEPPDAVFDLYLDHPRFWEIQEMLWRIAGQKGHPRPHHLFWGRLLHRGRLADGLRTLEMDGWLPRGPGCELRTAHALGIPIPPDLLEAHLKPGPDEEVSDLYAFCKGSYAVDRGDSAAFRRVLEAHRDRMAQARAAGDSANARDFTWSVNNLDAYARWKAGDPSGALPVFQHLVREYNFGWYEDLLMFWIGQIYLELGRPKEAVPYLATRRFPLPVAHDPLGDYHAAVALERAGRAAEARTRYGSLVEHWREADPELEPIVNEARRAMIRLARR